VKLYVWRLTNRCFFATADNKQDAFELVIKGMKEQNYGNLSEKKLCQYVEEKMKDTEPTIHDKPAGFFVL
jgi:hypothetical protein